MVNHAMAFGTRDLNPHFFIYPSLSFYVLFLLYAVLFVLGRLAGLFASTDDFLRLFFTDATLFYLPGRWIVALSGAASAWLAYELGRRCYGKHAGVVAASILAFSVLHVQYSHFLKTHVPGGLLAAGALCYAWSIYHYRGRPKHYALAGVLAGLAASTIYHAGFVAVSPVIAHLLHVLHHREVKERFWSPKLVILLGSASLAFVFTTPFALLDWRTFLSDLANTADLYYGGGAWEQGVVFPFTSLIEGFGQPLGLLVLLGLGYAVSRRAPANLILASQPLFLGLFLMAFRIKESQHMLVAYPALSILAGSLLADATGWLFARAPRWRTIGLVAMSSGILLPPAWVAVVQSYAYTQPDPRTLAKEWVEQNVPYGTGIVMDSGKYYFGAFGPPLPPSRWTLDRLVERSRASSVLTDARRRQGTRRAAYSGEATYFELQRKALAGMPGYDIFQLLHDVGSFPSDFLSYEAYVQENVRYAILNEGLWRQYLPGEHAALQWPEKAAEYRRFYETVVRHGRRIKEFRSPHWEGFSDLVIYELR